MSRSSDARGRWLPRLVSGDAIAALAMSEPGAGSDVKALATRAIRDGDRYVVNGSKTFISNGATVDLIITAVKTDPSAGRDGPSLLVIEGDASSPRKLRAGIATRGFDVLPVILNCPQIQVRPRRYAGDEQIDHGFKLAFIQEMGERVA